MLDDRSYMRANPQNPFRSTTVILMISVVVCFALQNIAGFYLHADLWMRDHLALSFEGLKEGFIWQLLSFQFLHGGLWHLIVNLLFIWFFGRTVEERLGPQAFLKLYFLCGIAGGVLQAVLGWLLPSHFGGPTVGASAGALGLLTAFALIEPNAVICFMFIIRMPAKVLLWIEVGIAAFFTLVPSDRGIAHAAHLGGILAAIAYMRWDPRRPVVNWNPLQGRRRKRQLVQAAAQITRWRGSRDAQSSELPPEEFISKEVDPILDKISAHGIHSLTPRERQILEAARAKMAKR